MADSIRRLKIVGVLVCVHLQASFCIGPNVSQGQIVRGQRSLSEESDRSAESSSKDVFEERIMPIFQSPNPSSCVECHLSGIDLKNYILPSQEDTFVALRDEGLIDIEDPESSRILELIRMGSDAYTESSEASDSDQNDTRIHEDNRQRELEAFSNWIRLAANDPELVNLPSSSDEDSSLQLRPLEVVRHNRLDRVTQSFVDNIWSLRFRCANCHMEGGHNFDRLVEENGPQMEWMIKDDPEATVRYLLESELIDWDEPEESLLLLKPLNEVEHGGGIKMARYDTDYMTFLSWMKDVAAVRADAYTTVDSIPSGTVYRGSEIWLRVEALPPLLEGVSGFLTVHRQTEHGWSEEPTAISSVNVRRNPRFGTFAQGFLCVQKLAESVDRRVLAHGRYLVKLSIDPGRDPNQFDFSTALADSTVIMEQEIESDWQSGFRFATNFISSIEQADLIAQIPGLKERIDCRVKLETIKLAVQAYRIDTNELPKRLEALTDATFVPEDDIRLWRGPYLREPANDIWGNMCRISRRAQGERLMIFIISPGPDGEFGTSDDLRLGPPPRGE